MRQRHHNSVVPPSDTVAVVGGRPVFRRIGFRYPGESQRFLVVAMRELKKLIGIEHG